MQLIEPDDEAFENFTLYDAEAEEEFGFDLDASLQRAQRKKLLGVCMSRLSAHHCLTHCMSGGDYVPGGSLIM